MTALNSKIVSLKKYRRGDGKFKSCVHGFLSTDLNTKILKFPNYWKIKVRTLIRCAYYYPEDEELSIYTIISEDGASLVDSAISTLGFRKISISSVLGCNNFSGRVKVKKKGIGTTNNYYIMKVLSTDFDYKVIYNEGSVVTFIFEGGVI